MASTDTLPVRLLVVILLLVVGIFIADIVLPLGVAGGAPYMAAVLLTLWLPQPRFTLIVALVSTVLTVLGFFLSPTGAILWQVISNRVLAFFAIWVTAFVVLQQHQSATALRENEARYRQVVEWSPDAIVVHRDGVILLANRAAATLLGAASPDDLVEHSILEFVHPTYRDLVSTRLQRLQQEGHVELTELQFVRLDSQVIDVEAAGIATVYQQAPAIQSVIRDITIRKQAEAALQKSEARLGRILDSAMDAIITLDSDQCIILFNPAAEHIFHCTAADIQGQPLTRLCSAALAQCIETFVQSEKAPLSMWLPDGLTARRMDGEEFPVEGTVSSVEGPDQTLYTVILRDINARKRTESALQVLQLENVYLQEEIKSTANFEEIVGTSAALKNVLQAVEQVAATDATVLLIGETGTGKELVARAIHNLSSRQDRPLIKVNCAALSAGLIESELFGHEKGSFTGAVARKDGRFALADKGTIFLDEVADIPPEVQIKLLRVLQEQEYERVGGTQSLKVDVRVIAATNRDLEQAMQAGQFRSDLYYRLHVFPIQLPPLRERRDDIPLLAKYFTMTYGKKLGKQLETISPQTMAALRSYSWPGNVRELEHVIERAVIVSQGPQLELGSWFSDADQISSPPQTRTLEEMERDYIIEVLEMTDWRVSGEGGAAEHLGMKRTTLESRMKRLGITRKG